MNLREYMDELQHQKSSAHIEMDPQKEVEYMAEHAYRLERTLQAIPKKSDNLKILDIGPTPFTIFLKYTFPHYDIYALDRTDLLKKRFENLDNGMIIRLESCDLDLGSIPFEDNAFDVVIFTEVLEHVFFPHSELLKEILRILRPSGKLILSVPNIATLSNRLRLLFGFSILKSADLQMNRDWIHGHAHIHEYTRKEISDLCKSIGFNIDKCEMLADSPLYFLRSRIKFSIKSFIYYTLLAFVPSFKRTIFLECFSGLEK